MTTSSDVRRALEEIRIDVDSSQQHVFTVHEESANLGDNLDPSSLKEKHSCRSQKFEHVEPRAHGSESEISHLETMEVKSRCDHKSVKGKKVTDGDTGSKSKTPPIQAIEASLRRWILYLEEHEVSASYADLLLLQASAKRFMDLVDFYFLTLVDLLMKSSKIFESSEISIDDGIAFPPPSALKLAATERSKLDIPFFKSRARSRGEFSKQNPRAGTSSQGQGRNDLHILQDWLTDGIDYLENEPVKVYYEDFRVLHATTKKLVELMDTYLKDLVDTLLEKCVLRAENE